MMEVDMPDDLEDRIKDIQKRGGRKPKTTTKGKRGRPKNNTLNINKPSYNKSQFVQRMPIREVHDTDNVKDVVVDDLVLHGDEIEIGDNELEDVANLIGKENINDSGSKSNKSSKKWTDEDHAIVLSENTIDDDKYSKQSTHEPDIEPFAVEMLVNDQFKFLERKNKKNEASGYEQDYKSYSRTHDDEERYSNDKRKSESRYSEKSNHSHHSHHSHHSKYSSSSSDDKHDKHHDDVSEKDKYNDYERDRDRERDKDIERERDKEYEREKERERDREREREQQYEMEKEREYEREKMREQLYTENQDNHDRISTHFEDEQRSYRPTMSYEEVSKKKRYYLSEILNMQDKYKYVLDGVQPTMAMDLEVIENYFNLLSDRRLKDKCISDQKELLQWTVRSVEYLNRFVRRMFGIGFYLDGWSAQVISNLNENNDLFEELYKKYGNKLTLPPELKLAGIVIGSAAVFHMDRSGIEKDSSVSFMAETINSDPRLKSLYVEISNERKREMEKNAPAPNEVKSQANGGGGILSDLFGGMFGLGGGGKQPQPIDPTTMYSKVPDMPTPREIDELANNLKEQQTMGDLEFSTHAI